MYSVVDLPWVFEKSDSIHTASSNASISGQKMAVAFGPQFARLSNCATLAWWDTERGTYPSMTNERYGQLTHPLRDFVIQRVHQIG